MKAKKKSASDGVKGDNEELSSSVYTFKNMNNNVFPNLTPQLLSNEMNGEKENIESEIAKGSAIANANSSESSKTNLKRKNEDDGGEQEKKKAKIKGTAAESESKEAAQIDNFTLDEIFKAIPDDVAKTAALEASRLIQIELIEPTKAEKKVKNFEGRPFKCDYCVYAAKTSQNLVIHRRVHTGEKPYKCTLCNFASSQGGPLKYHMAKYHPSDESSTSSPTSSKVAKKTPKAKKTPIEKKEGGEGEEEGGEEEKEGKAPLSQRSSARAKKSINYEEIDEEEDEDVEMLEVSESGKQVSGSEKQVNSVSSETKIKKEPMKRGRKPKPKPELENVALEKVEMANPAATEIIETKPVEPLVELPWIKQYNCPYCQFSVDDLAMINSHIENHKLTKPKEYKCEMCNHSEKNRSLLIAHQRKHIGKALRCQLCTFTDNQIPVLMSHRLYFHSGERMLTSTTIDTKLMPQPNVMEMPKPREIQPKPIEAEKRAATSATTTAVQNIAMQSLYRIMNNHTAAHQNVAAPPSVFGIPPIQTDMEIIPPILTEENEVNQQNLFGLPRFENC